MSADNLVYLQRCQDGVWRAWEDSASTDPARPTSGFIVETTSRTDAVVAAHDWCHTHTVEYGVVEIEDEQPQKQKYKDLWCSAGALYSKAHENAVAQETMQSLSEARKAEALPEDALDALEQAAAALIASVAVYRASNEKK